MVPPALCVHASFDTASENLARVLARVRATQSANPHSKHLRVGGAANAERGDDGRGAGVIEGEVGGDVGREEHRAMPPAQTLALATHATRVFAPLVAACTLPEELIVRVLLVAQGAVWVGRMIGRRPRAHMETRKLGKDQGTTTWSPRGCGFERAAPNPTQNPASAAAPGVGGVLAERFSAEFRRTLPALRAGSNSGIGVGGRGRGQIGIVREGRRGKGLPALSVGAVAEGTADDEGIEASTARAHGRALSTPVSA
ncbi:hypothetical protein B0H16DRAFT_1745567 [Mycena metata]|uniref:Uncharacterized protein n=1 Tax=Mycena metata TaxID=1033252 RepID=A0AAD7GMP9_9AGAR|nr:hypothetical protein B0H16DRAFT_1749771 [Mycena metata]KAJ7710294.1 hypothetical protein B0H16DRAFT_1745567 [Mycena metata]